MLKKIILVGLWFPATFIVLLITIFASQRYSQVRDGHLLAKEIIREHLAQNGYQIYAALPSVLGSFTTAIETGDARPEIVKRYLEKYDSPLLPYAGEIVRLSDKNNLDFRLIVSIAQCESNVCKKIPEGSYNCWGFENGATKFGSWEHALQRVAKTLKEGYIDQGLVTPEQIMPKYAPPSVAKGGPWAKCVNHFFEEME
ncbi:hypothetical protein HY439_01020 [Candidatus Microgenomates bacterium]|nr:hypothetical protein [Candidatus Microgenomates bacterium]